MHHLAVSLIYLHYLLKWKSLTTYYTGSTESPERSAGLTRKRASQQTSQWISRLHMAKVESTALGA